MTSATQVARRTTTKEIPNRPIFATESLGLPPFGDQLSHLASIPASRMFLVKRSLAGYRLRYPDRPVFDASQGDGGASLPGVPENLLRRALELQIRHGTSYDPPTGSHEFRKAVIEEYWALDPDLGFGPENVAAAVGGRDGLTKAYQAILGLGFGSLGDAVLVSRVPWISYNWGPASVGANTLLAPGEAEDSWMITPEAVRESVRYAQAGQRDVVALVITSPDNPTGRWMPTRTQVELAKCALEAGIPFVIFDWIYHQVTDIGPMDLNEVLQQFEAEEREQLIFLDGLTKSLGGSNIRGAHLIAPGRVIQFVNAQASHNVIPPYFPQAVLLAALEEGFSNAIEPILKPTNESRRLLREFLDLHRFRFIMDQGYYAFIDVGDWIDRAGWRDSEDLGEYLADQHGLAVVPGIHFSVFGSRWIRFSYAADPAYTMAAALRLKEGLDSIH